MATNDVKFPEITVELSGHDGNAFAILGKVTRALKKGGATQAEVSEFFDEATSGGYDHLLATVMRTVDVV